MLGNATIITTLPATDLERAGRFYGDVLGLARVDDEDARSAIGLIRFKANNGTQLALYQRGPTVADHTVVTFIVSDLDSVVDGLAARGVRFEQYDLPGLKTDARGIATYGRFRTAWFLDTEGNILSVGAG